jgi:hypothetical protein
VAPIGRHAIACCHRAQGHGVLVGALIAHHAHAAHGQEDGPGLPHLVVEALVLQALDEDVVHLLQQGHLLLGDVAQDADGQARPREGMAAQDVGVQAEFACPPRRTSSLNSRRRGSTTRSFMRSGRPPTLWWLLMVALGPFTLTLSITSG